MPHEPRFYKDLAIGYTQIRYYQQGRKALAEASRRSSADPELAELRKLIEAKRAGDPAPRD